MKWRLWRGGSDFAADLHGSELTTETQRHGEFEEALDDVAGIVALSAECIGPSLRSGDKAFSNTLFPNTTLFWY
jgi:hypothetical protein